MKAKPDGSTDIHVEDNTMHTDEERKEERVTPKTTQPPETGGKNEDTVLTITNNVSVHKDDVRPTFNVVVGSTKKVTASTSKDKMIASPSNLSAQSPDSIDGGRNHKKKSLSDSGIIQSWQGKGISKFGGNETHHIMGGKRVIRDRRRSTSFVPNTADATTRTHGEQLKKAASASAVIETLRKRNPKGVNRDKKHQCTPITPVDLDMLRSLENEYSAAAQLTASYHKAQRIWARRAGLASVIFVLLYLTVGVIVFLHFADGHEDWTILNAVFFAMYTVTSSGFGHIDTPDSNAYYIFDSIYVIVGIGVLTIMVAQIFSWMELEAAQAHDRRKALELASENNVTAEGINNDLKRGHSTIGALFWKQFDQCLPWMQESDAGRCVAVFLSLTCITLGGAVPIGILEGWSFFQIIYFGCVTMTTVGYGDFVPSTRAGITICIAWLPLSVLFSSIYMGSIAKWYLSFSARGVQRIAKALNDEAMGIDENFEHSLTTAPKHPSMRAADVRIDATGLDTESGLNAEFYETFSLNSDKATGEFYGNPRHGKMEHIPEGEEEKNENTRAVVFENINSRLITMQDVVEAIHKNMKITGENSTVLPKENNSVISDSERFLSLQNGPENTFALRMLVKERIARIIAYDICGGAHNVDVKEDHIVVKIGRWKDVVKKWSIPTGAWKAFRAVALGSIMRVGERALIRDGPAALLQLSPDEFHSMFSPLIAAMGNPDILSGWLKSTDELAQQHLTDGENNTEKEPRRLAVEDPVVQMPHTFPDLFQ